MMKMFIRMFLWSLLTLGVFGVSTGYAAFLTSLDIGTAPALVEIGPDYVLLEVAEKETATGYRVFYSDQPFRGDEKNFVQSEGRNVVLVPKLQPGVRYYFSAVSYDAAGNESASFSPSVSFMLAREGASALLDLTEPFKEELNVPSPPSVVRAGAGLVTVSWPTVSGASHYKLYVGENETVVRGVHPFYKVFGGTGVTLANLEAERSYHFGVVAVDRAGFESVRMSTNAVANFATMDTMITRQDLALLLPPSSIFIDQYKRTIRWEQVDGAESYVLWKSRYPFRDTMYTSPYMEMGRTSNSFWNITADPEEPIFYLAVQPIAGDGSRGVLSEPVKIIFPHDGRRRHLATVFTDIDESSWYASALVYLLQEGVVSRNADRRFKPGDSINRAEFSKMLLELRRLPLVQGGAQVFCDTDYGAWYGPYVRTMTHYGFTQGYVGGSCASNREFRPARNVSRAEALRFLFQAFQIEPAPMVVNLPADFEDVHPEDWFYHDVVFASRINLVSGYVRDGKKYYDPHRVITRTEAAQLMYKFITQLDYQYHRDGAAYLYSRHDNRYRLGLNINQRPVVEEIDNGMVRIAWTPLGRAAYYRLYISPERRLDKTTPNVLPVSVSTQDLVALGGGRVAVELPRSLMPGGFYSVAMIAFDEDFNESWDYSMVATITLEPLPDGAAREEALYGSELEETATISEEAPSTTREEEIVIPVRDASCMSVGRYLHHDVEGYETFVERCSAQYMVSSLEECSVVGGEEGNHCLMVQGYKQQSGELCSTLGGIAGQWCSLGYGLLQPTTLQCSRLSIIPSTTCAWYVATATGVTSAQEFRCNTMTGEDRRRCLVTYVHHHYTPAQCTTYKATNQTLLDRNDPATTAIVQACDAFHGTESGGPVLSTADQRRQRDLREMGAAVHSYYATSPPSFVPQCLTETAEVVVAMRTAGKLDIVAMDPSSRANSGLCPGEGGVYWFSELRDGERAVGVVLVAELDTAHGALYTAGEVKTMTSMPVLEQLQQSRPTAAVQTTQRYWVETVFFE